MLLRSSISTLMLALFGLLAWGGCSSSEDASPSPSTLDGSADSGEADGAADTGADGALDGGTDGASDAGSDAMDASADAAPEADVAAVPALDPFVPRGGGKETTGGRSPSSHVIFITSLADDAGTPNSIRWALDQFPGAPLYVALAVEGELSLETTLRITRPDVTIDGRLAPGQGTWITGKRFEPQADNFMMIGVRHLGNDPEGDGNSDTLSIGPFDKPGDAVTSNHYYRECEFRHGQDEVWAATPRQNGAATGNIVEKVTVDRCMIANPTGDGHPFGVFVGDGVHDITFVESLFYNYTDRYPFVRDYAERVEVLNVFKAGAFNENFSHFLGSGIVRHCQIQLHPTWNDIRALYNVTDGLVWFEDVVVTSEVGKTNNHGLTRGGAPAATPQFTQTVDDGSLVEGQNVKTLVLGLDGKRAVGAPIYGGFLNDAAQDVIDDANDGTRATVAQHPGPLPVATGASYPPSNANMVPDNYLQWYPSGTNPEAVISDGSSWDGYLEVERIGAFLVSELYGTSP